MGRSGAARPATTISVRERDRQPGAERISSLRVITCERRGQHLLPIYSPKIRLLANDASSSICYAGFTERMLSVSGTKGKMIMHQELSETLACRLNLHRVLFRSLCCILFLLLAECASSTASSSTGTAGTSTPTATPTMAPTATPTPNIPTLSTALLTYKGHSKAILGFAWSPDGKEIASGGGDGSVTLLNAPTGKPIANYGSQADFIQGLAWSPGGKEIASSSQDGTIQNWRPQI